MLFCALGQCNPISLESIWKGGCVGWGEAEEGGGEFRCKHIGASWEGWKRLPRALRKESVMCCSTMVSMRTRSAKRQV